MAYRSKRGVWSGMGYTMPGKTCPPPIPAGLKTVVTGTPGPGECAIRDTACVEQNGRLMDQYNVDMGICNGVFPPGTTVDMGYISGLPNQYPGQYSSYVPPPPPVVKAAPPVSVQTTPQGQQIIKSSDAGNAPQGPAPSTVRRGTDCFSIVNKWMTGDSDTSVCYGPATQVTWALGGVVAFGLYWMFGRARR